MTPRRDEPESADPRTPPVPGPADPAASGPDDPAAPPATGADRLLAALRDEPPAGGTDAPGGTPPGMDELTLRRLLHDAVRSVEPRPDALDRLSRAVPARRARRRQAAVGAAAGVLLVGTAMPAVLHATQPAADTAGNVNAAGGLAPGTSPARHGGGTGPVLPGATPVPGTPVPGLTPGATAPSPDGAPGTVTAPVPGGGSSLVDTPACVRTQLGSGTASLTAPDADGRVYGTFRVVNVSDRSCTVTGRSEISVTGQGGTDASQIQVVDHTEGDPASGLPDPADEPAAVILPPGQAYQVEFAWIPASGGGPSGCGPVTSPPPSGDSGADGGSSADGGTGDPSGGASDAPDATATYHPVTLDGDDGGSDGGSSASPPDDGGSTSPTPPGGDGIALADTPPEGAPAAASADITGACAGTVYRTDPMPTP
jgi:hypothetical protein